MIIKRGEGQIVEVLDDDNDFVNPDKTKEALDNAKKKTNNTSEKDKNKNTTN